MSEPFFKPADSDMSYRDAMTTAGISIEKANRLVEPLTQENERLRDCEITLGEFIAEVKHLQGKVKSLEAENETLLERLRSIS